MQKLNNIFEIYGRLNIEIQFTCAELIIPQHVLRDIVVLDL